MAELMKTYTERQTQIIDKSIKIIADKGIQQLTIKNLSKSLGVSEPAIYRHFKSKIDILLAILDNFSKIPDELHSEGKNQGKSINILENIFLSHIGYFSKNSAQAAVIFSEEIFQNDTRLSEKVYSIMEKNETRILKIIKNGQSKKEIREDITAEHIATIVIGSLRFLVTKWRLSNLSFNLEEKGRTVWNSIEKMIIGRKQ